MRFLHIVVFLGAVSVISPWNRAQARTAQASSPARARAAFNGIISDLKGNPVAGAEIRATSEKGTPFTARSDAQGNYSLPADAPGTYDLTVSAPGFKPFTASGVILGPGDSVPIDAALEPTSPDQPAPSSTAPPGAVASPQPTPQGGPELPASPAAPVLQSAPSPAATKGAITGTVSDQTGAVVAGATVTAKSTTSGEAKATTTGANGTYALKLPPGSYTITVTAPGFKAFEVPDLSLTDEGLPLDAGLEPAGEKTEVNVESQGAAAVNTETAQVSGTITQKEVHTLQLNGRNFTQLIALAPGVSNQTGQDEAKVGVTGSVKYSVNGGRVEYNTFEVDGGDVLNAGLNGAESTLMVYPSLDAIQDVKVLTSNYGAMYGRTASGTVQVTTKSGTRDFHGNAYYYLRNEAFNARNYFDQTTSAPLYRRHDFGFTLGGPIFIPNVYNTKKDKTFFFWSTEFRIERSPSELTPTFNHAVPTLAERAGNFSDVCPLYGTTGSSGFLISQYPDCPGVVKLPGVSRTPYRNNDIADPTSGQLDPAAVSILNQNLIPLPNSYTGCNSSLVGKLDPSTGALIKPCYTAVISEPTYWREELLRLDHNFTTTMRATLRYIHDSWDTTTSVPQWGYVNNSFPTVQNRFVGPGTNLVLRLTDAISPSLVNEFVASYSNQTITLADQNGPGGADYTRPPQLDTTMGSLFNNGFGGKAPGLVIAGNNAEYGGAGFAVDTSYMPWSHTNPTYSFRDDVGKQLGKHFLQFGGLFVIYQRNQTNGAIGAASGDVQGLLTFSNIASNGVGNTGNAFANFLFQPTGGFNYIASYLQDSTQRRYYQRYQIGEPYIQDDWKITTRLTLNLGLRVSLFGTYHDKNQSVYNWDPTKYDPALAATMHVDPTTGQLLNKNGFTPVPLDPNNLDPRITNGLVLCGSNGVPQGCMKGHLLNPAPRVGIAWDPSGNGKTAIRAGYGIFFEHGTGAEANTGSLEGSAPLVLTMQQQFPLSYRCIGNAAGAANCNSARPGAFPINVTAIPSKAVWPYAQQYSLGLQRELPRSMVATFAYVGSKGTHLTVQRQLNQVHPVQAAVNPFAPFEPLIPGQGGNAGDCTTFNGADSFTLLNGTTVTNRNPAFINLIAACSGRNSGNPTPNVNTLRPYLGLAQIYSLENIASANYNAFQATLRRTRGPLTLGVSYSYGHSFDEASDRSDISLVNSYDLRSNYASSSFDQRHLLSVSYVYSLPNAARILDWIYDKPITNSEVSDSVAQPSDPSKWSHAFLDGWEFSGITLFASGTPFSVVNGGSPSGISVVDNAGVANGVGPGSYPDIARGSFEPANNPLSFGPLLGNPAHFVAPRGLTFGDAGRNSLNNPSRLNFDMALLKHFKITEGSNLEFRVEAFNVFNHTQFRIYNPNLGNTGSNIISCYGGPDYSAGFIEQGGADCVTGSAFLHPVDAHRPRTVQFALKFAF